MRNVIVTGGTRGLGLAAASALAAAGFRVIAVARRAGEAFDRERERLDSRGDALLFEPYDLAETDGIGDAVKGWRDRHGQLWGLVNNAAVSASGVLATASEADMAQAVHLNVLSPLVLTKHVVRSMLSGRGGRIVNIASIVAATGYSGLSVYSASKAALIGFTRSLARELGPADITVNAVAPGFVATDMTGEMAPADRAKIARRSALQRPAEPQDVAAAIAFLFSDAARNITGTVVTVDAGNTA